MARLKISKRDTSVNPEKIMHIYELGASQTIDGVNSPLEFGQKSSFSHHPSSMRLCPKQLKAFCAVVFDCLMESKGQYGSLPGHVHIPRRSKG
jgi:hypothetical protein